MTEPSGQFAQRLTRRWGPRGTVVLLALAAIIFLLIGAALGVALAPQRQTSGTSAVPNSVDIGFAQDMIVHHNQGVLMAHYAELDTTDTDIATLAYDINYTQTAQLGQLQGYLALWGAPTADPGTPMAWMGSQDPMAGMNMGGAQASGATVTVSGTVPSDLATTAPDAALGAIMPGMASNGEMSKLKSLQGKASDIYFLQLMIRHHQGGAAMMVFATEHAAVPSLRNLAGQMLQAQTAEVAQMTQLLQGFGAEPLPTS